MSGGYPEVYGRQVYRVDQLCGHQRRDHDAVGGLDPGDRLDLRVAECGRRGW